MTICEGQIQTSDGTKGGGIKSVEYLRREFDGLSGLLKLRN